MIDRLASVVSELGDGLMRWREAAMGGEWHGPQLKTKADREAHRDLSRALKGLLDLPVVSEEDPVNHDAVRHERYWLIDPIDGTASLAGGFPGFVMQAALMEADLPVAAAIRAPALDLLYLAETGRGATCNGVPIEVAPSAARVALIDNNPEPRGLADRLMAELPCTDYVESGSISLKICRVADGTADVFAKDVPVRDWDVAAPWLVLREAGGCVTGLDEAAYRFVGPMEKLGIVAASTAELAGRAAKVARGGLQR